MTPNQKAELRAALIEAFSSVIEQIGVETFKRTSWFGSNDSAFKALKVVMKQAA